MSTEAPFIYYYQLIWNSDLDYDDKAALERTALEMTHREGTN